MPRAWLLVSTCVAMACASPATATRDADAAPDVAPDVVPDVSPDAAPDAAPDAPSRDAAASGWRTEPRLPAVWQEIAGDVIDGRLWVIGGFEGGRPSDAVRVFDPAVGRWEDGPRLPARLHHMAAVAVDGDLYALGGYLDFSFTPVSQCYVLRRGATAWATIRALPEPRGAATAGVIGGRVVVAGGYGTSQRLLGPVAIYDPPTDTWTAGSALPTPREHLASVVHDGRLWVFGGRRGGLDSVLAAVEAYDPAADAWRSDLPPMPLPRGGFAAARLGGTVYVLGGERSDGVHTEVDALDLATLTWRPAPPLPTARHGFVALAAAGRVWAIGGADRPTFAPVDVVESYGP